MRGRDQGAPRPRARAQPAGALPSTWSPTGRRARRPRAWQRIAPRRRRAASRRIADQPQGLWLGEWRRDVRAAVGRGGCGPRVATGATPILVAYNIPHRDCGQHSSGGASDAAPTAPGSPRSRGASAARPAIVILEPDALAGMGCLLAPRPRASGSGCIARRGRRASRPCPQTAVYIDAGNPGWMPGQESSRGACARRASAGRAASRSTSPASRPPRARRAFGRAVSRRTGGAHFVIDTSRNGLGPRRLRRVVQPARPRARRPPDHAKRAIRSWTPTSGSSARASRTAPCNGGPPAGRLVARVRPRPRARRRRRLTRLTRRPRRPRTADAGR